MWVKMAKCLSRTTGRNIVMELYFILLACCAFWVSQSQFFTSEDISLNIARFDRNIEGIDDSSFETNVLPKYKKKEMQREFLNLLGLRQRPRPATLRGGQNHSAPQFMLDLYNSLNVMVDNAEENYNEYLYGYPRNVLSSVLNMGVFNYTNTEVDALGKADTIMSLPVIRRDALVEKHGAHRYHFGVTFVPQHDVINNAELRVFRTEPKEGFRESVYNVKVYQVMHSIPYSKDTGLMFLDSVVLDANDHGWMVFDITYASAMLKTYPGARLSVQLVVETFHGDKVDPTDIGLLGVDGDEDREPFMVVFFTTDEALVGDHLTRLRRSSKKTKKKRKGPTNSVQDDPIPSRMNVDDDSDSHRSRQECRRINLYVSFEELEWNNWIIAPKGYRAYYCQGECSFPLHTRLNATNHAIIQTLVNLFSPRVVPQACCAPTKLTSIQVLYFDEEMNVILRKYKNMVVKSCGCH